MLSIKTAKVLQEVGLKWEPQLGDIFVADYDNGLGPTKPQVVKTTNFGEPGPEHIWLPRLDQLLAEIEKRGYDWLLKTDYCYVVNNKNQGQNIYADNPEEAAAKALLWILKQKKLSGFPMGESLEIGDAVMLKDGKLYRAKGAK